MKQATGSVSGQLTLENPVFANFAFYAICVLIKMLFMAAFTARQRFLKKVRKQLSIDNRGRCIFGLRTFWMTLSILAVIDLGTIHSVRTHNFGLI